jgi:hypothetical protein
MPGQAYLLRQEKRLVPIDYPIDDSPSEAEEKAFTKQSEDWSKEFDICVDPFEAPIKERPLVIEHHILWSMSYAVPVIYFNGWKSGEYHYSTAYRFITMVRDARISLNDTSCSKFECPENVILSSEANLLTNVTELYIIILIIVQHYRVQQCIHSCDQNFCNS